MIDFQSVLHSGVNAGMPKKLAEKVILSNIFSFLLVGLVGIPFTVISWLEAPPVLFIPVVGSLLAMLTPVFNKLGFYNFSRLLFSYILFVAVVTFHGYAVSAGDSRLLSMTILHLGFTLVPFLLFNLKEWPLLLLCVLPSTIMMIAFDPINDLLELPVDDTFLRERGFYFYLTLIVGILASFSSLLGLVIMHETAENKNEKILSEMELQKNQLSSRESELEENLEALKKARDEEELRQYYAEGVAHFSQILRQEENIEALSDRLVSELCKFLKVNQAGFFIVDKEQEHLQLTASYAFNRKKYLTKTISFGQGLVGQAYLEKEYTYITEVPQNYIAITSGLGDAPPRSVLIVPLLFNEEVKAIIEMASFKEFTKYEIEFIQKIGEGIAATLYNLETNQRTVRLLDEMQGNSELLQQQEEEMRQNMEELSATQEQMHRKEKEYLKRIEELEKIVQAGA